MKTNIKRLFKLIGILTAVVIVTLTGIYFIQTRTIASNRTYKAVTVNVEAEEATADSTEAVTEEQQTTENTTTVEETVATTEEIETATTEAVTETAAVQTIVTEAAKETVPETEMVPETAAAAVTEPVTEVHKTTSQVNNSDYTNVVFKNATDTYKFDTLTAAKEAVNVKRLSDEAARSLAKSNETLYASQVEELVGLINEYRTANGLNKVDLTANLTDAAMHRATESAYSDWNMTAYEKGSKRHIRPNFEKASSIATEYGITGNFGENYGRYFDTPAEILNGWKNSDAHNALLLNGSYTKAGIGIAADSDGYLYWIAIFN